MIKVIEEQSDNNSFPMKELKPGEAAVIVESGMHTGRVVLCVSDKNTVYLILPTMPDVGVINGHDCFGGDCTLLVRRLRTGEKYLLEIS
jgi:hypothetical protein